MLILLLYIYICILVLKKVFSIGYDLIYLRKYLIWKRGLDIEIKYFLGLDYL